MDASKKYDNPNPRLSANALSKLLFWWLKPLFWQGWNHDLETKDLYNVLPKDVSENLGDKLDRNWSKELRRAKEAGRKPSLYNALRNTFIWSFAFYGGWTFFYSVVLRVLQPFILGYLIWHFDPRATSTAAQAYLYASGVVVVALLTAFVNHHSFLGQMEIGMRMRIASSSLVYRKILRLSKSSTSTTTPGQIINLLSNDVSRFDQLFVMLHYIWIMPIQGALIAFLIWESVGIASLAGIFLITVQTIPVQGYMSKWTAKLRLKIALRTDERVRLMSEIINGIQVIKMYAWEKPFQALVSMARSYEVDVLTLTSYLRGFTLASFVFTERTTLYFTIMAYVLLGNSISADKVFSMAQYFNILQATMAIFYPMAVSFAAEAAVSIRRLENFLLLDETLAQVHAIQPDKNESIVMKEVTASWTGNKIANTLHDITISIKSGKLYAIVGTVGAGKSSFLNLILGELRATHGDVCVDGTVSYASQEPWLFTGSVRSNILFGQPYEEKRYREVVKVCSLLKDFEQFPAGDKTLVGDRGAALSGGQRARINLARAIYRQADIYLLDDPLSAVDTHVGRHLFDECISAHLRNKTRILVTHQVQYLKSCDYIVVLNNGKIENTGTFAELQGKQVDFLQILENEEGKESPDDSETTSIAQDVTTNGQGDEDEEESDPQETEELIAKGKMSKSLYWKYFRAGGTIFMIVVFIVTGILGQIGSSGSDYWVAYWTNQQELYIKNMKKHMSYNLNSTLTNSTMLSLEMSTDSALLSNETFAESLELENLDNSTVPPSLDMFNMTQDALTEADGYYLEPNTALWIYGAFIVTSIVMTTTRNLLFYKICMNASKNLHNLMFSSLLQAPMRFFDTNPAGRILNRFSKDVGAVDEILPRTMIESIQIFMVMIGILTQVLLINWWSVFPMVVMAFLYSMIRNVYIKTAQNLKRLEGTLKSPVFSHVNSSMLGLTTIRSSKAEMIVRKEFDVHQDVHTRAYFLTISTSTAFGFALDIVSIAFVAFVTYSFIILDNGNTFSGNVGLAISQVLILCGMLQHGMRQTAETVAQMTSVERILQFTQLEKEGPFDSDPLKKPPRTWPSKGKIEFESVYLRYGDSTEPVLKGLSVLIEPGMKVGIVGRTGAGKSSLISALFRLAKLDGAIRIDGIDTKDVGLHDLRNKISIIPQEPMLFTGTLRENLDPLHGYDDVALWDALDEVELKGAVSSLDHQVEQDGRNFSAGQRQLLCLARAIIQNNKVLILDEATANVDPGTDVLIQKTIRQKFKDCTVLTIAHRLNTIMDSDRVLVMEHGEIVEFDHPHILLGNKLGYFTSMLHETGKTMFEQLRKISEEAYNKYPERDLSQILPPYSE
ncbi:hypothetical protein KM043_001089 [Ampulex compressa]|nr:hypothetical protein KM043_001089 [Ampulex compressa]